MPDLPTTPGKRALNRARNEKAIIDAAEKLLVEQGTVGLTWRGVAHEAGLAPSALYRYVDGLDALITTLIVRAYEEVGAAAREAYRAADHSDPIETLVATASGIRRWAVKHPHQYALVYGSPIPGYRAPETTIEPASQVGLVLLEAFRLAYDERPGRPAKHDAKRGARTDATADRGGTQPAADLSALIDPSLTPQLDIPPELAVEAVDLWAHLFGLISFELFGHFVNVVADPEGYFADRMRAAARRCLDAIH